MNRDLVLILMVSATLPISFIRPWIGVLVYTWLSTMVPQRSTWGIAYNLPFIKVVAVVTLVGLLFTKQRYPLPRRPEVVLLVLLWIVFTGSTWLTAFEPARAIPKWEETTKILVMAGTVLLLFQDRRKLRLLLLVMAMSIGFYGVKGSIWAMMTGLQSRLFGPADSHLADNNALGFAFTMALPLLALLRQDTRVPLLRPILLGTFGAVIGALFATYSRGAVVGFAVVLPLLALLIRLKDKPLFAVGLVACLVIYFAPRQWAERMQSITPTVYRTDSSGWQRMQSWYVAWRIGIDHPLLGAGCHPFSAEVYERYIPDYVDQHEAHNHFLQMLAEHGFSGLLLFVALLTTVLVRLMRLVSRTRGDPGHAWIMHTAQMIGLSLIAYIAGGIFINHPHSEWLYQLIVAAVVLDAIAASPHPDGPLPTGESLLRAGIRRLRR